METWPAATQLAGNAIRTLDRAILAIFGVEIALRLYVHWLAFWRDPTLESWSMGIARPVMEQFPYAWAFFIPFILVATFTMLNLFIAIIVNAMQSYSEAEHQETVQALQTTQDHIEADLHGELRALRAEIGDLKRILAERTADEAGSFGGSLTAVDDTSWCTSRVFLGPSCSPATGAASRA